jgi:hypothetical protein
MYAWFRLSVRHPCHTSLLSNKALRFLTHQAFFHQRSQDHQESAPAESKDLRLRKKILYYESKESQLSTWSPQPKFTESVNLESLRTEFTVSTRFQSYCTVHYVHRIRHFSKTTKSFEAHITDDYMNFTVQISAETKRWKISGSMEWPAEVTGSIVVFKR